MSLLLHFSNVPEEVGKIFSRIPLDVWDSIVMREPEAKLSDQLPRYGFGKFATLMVITALNDYQLKGPAEEKYWPPLHELIKSNPVPTKPEDLEKLLKKFYEKERLRETKIKRVEKFLESPLARKLWTSSPQEIVENFKDIWIELSIVMGQKKEAKTIVFSMKLLGIALILSGYPEFDFEGIPIPVDIRVRRLTSKLAGYELTDEEVRIFWGRVLKTIRHSQPRVNMVHLDSLVWQIGNLSHCKDILTYFEGYSLLKIGEKLCEMMDGNSENRS